jgi:D-alanyl-lipoteichoic acid acyltransferase DltB (MBOAT superfamily)
LFDIYYGKASAQKNVLHVGLYISLFPQLIAGPIVRYADIEREILYRQETRQDFTNGMIRFSYGLAKKTLLANYLAVIAMQSRFMSDQEPLSIAAAWLGAVAYTLQIYFDFSGYSDMAIGLGQMFGFHFRENFNYPYISRSVTEFWRRWHISLSSWFRDYVYIPLGGSRCSRSRLALNLFIVWSLTGFWHGANWTFICWGSLHGILLCIEKACGIGKQKYSGYKKLSHWAVTFALVCFSWILFRASNLNDAVVVVSGIFCKMGLPNVTFAMFTELCLAALAITLLLIKELSDEFCWKSHICKSHYWLVQHLYIVGMIAMILLFGVLGGDQFIYFQF